MKHEHHSDTKSVEQSKATAGCHHQMHDMHQREISAPKTEEAVIYTCPMHLEIHQSRPGNCPICGMALEPVIATKDIVQNLEYVDMRRRFWVAFMLTLPVFALMMIGHKQAHFISALASIWIQVVL